MSDTDVKYRIWLCYVGTDFDDAETTEEVIARESNPYSPYQGERMFGHHDNNEDDRDYVDAPGYSVFMETGEASMKDLRRNKIDPEGKLIIFTKLIHNM